MIPAGKINLLLIWNFLRGPHLLMLSLSGKLKNAHVSFSHMWLASPSKLNTDSTSVGRFRGLRSKL